MSLRSGCRGSWDAVGGVTAGSHAAGPHVVAVRCEASRRVDPGGHSRHQPTPTPPIFITIIDKYTYIDIYLFIIIIIDYVVCKLQVVS